MAVILAFDSTAIQYYCEIVARSVAQQYAGNACYVRAVSPDHTLTLDASVGFITATVKMAYIANSHS